MGADFSNHRLFAGQANPERFREEALARVRTFFQKSSFSEIVDETAASRSLVAGPPDRWLFLGDSAGSTDSQDLKGFEALSRALSFLGPVVDTIMSDDAAVHFYLYQHGALVDKFGNAAFPFFSFATDEDAKEFGGNPHLWRHLLAAGRQENMLREVWVQEWKARQIVEATAELYGWDARLLWVGYTYDDEGDGMKYDDYLRDEGIEIKGMEEFHFGRKPI